MQSSHPIQPVQSAPIIKPSSQPSRPMPSLVSPPQVVPTVIQPSIPSQQPKILPIPQAVAVATESPAGLQRVPSLQLYSVPSVYPSASPQPYLPPTASVVPTAYQPLSMTARYSLNHIPSEAGLRDPGYQSSLISRESLAYPDVYRWDPTMGQLQRAPDSVKTMNVSVYNTSSTQPLILPLRRSVSNSSQELARKPLSSRMSGELGLSEEVRMDSINLWGVTALSEMQMATPRTELQSEVCFDDGSEGNTPNVPQAANANVDSEVALKRGASRESSTGAAPYAGSDVLQSVNSLLSTRGYSTNPSTVVF